MDYFNVLFKFPFKTSSLFLISLWLYSPFSNAQLPGVGFVTEWDTEAETSIVIPKQSGGRWDIYWEEIGNPGHNGHVTLLNADANVNNPTIDFGTPGQYRVEMTGNVRRILFDNAGDKDKIRKIVQWGDIKWTSLVSAFYGCSNLEITATDAPDLTSLNANQLSLANLFRDCASLTGVGANWNWETSGITSFANVFNNASAFNNSLGAWDLSSATNLTNMLSGSGMDCGKAALTLRGWADNPGTPNNLGLGIEGLQYSDDAITIAAVNELENNKGWTFDGGDCDCFGPVACDERLLPVALIDFKAIKNVNSVTLSWSTGTESNSAGFNVERKGEKNDAEEWRVLTFVSSKAADGNSNARLDYSFEDSNPLSGVSYYRLQQRDMDGQSKYSLVRAVNFENNLVDIQIVPNPIKDDVKIVRLRGGETIKVFDINGRLLSSSVNNQSGSFSVSLSRYGTGIYLIKVKAKGGVSKTMKVVKR